MNLGLFEKSKQLYISYDKVYRNAKKIAESLFKIIVFLFLLIFGFVGNLEVNPDASVKLAIIECGGTFIIIGICVYFMNKYQDMSEEYKEKAKNEYIELLKI